MKANAALLAIAVKYFGPSLLAILRQYNLGIQIGGTYDRAFFSAVCPSVADTQPRMTELTAYAPEANKKQETYLAATFIVTHEITKPTNAAPMHTVICQVLSLNLPEVKPMTMPKRPDTRYGGQVSTSVIVRSKPRLPTTVGKKLLKLQAERCMFCMKQKRYKRGSRMACANPARAPLEASMPTVSRTMRSCASCLSSGVSQRVVRGKSGSIHMPTMAMANVTIPVRVVSIFYMPPDMHQYDEPSMMKSHFHPAMP